MTAKQRPSAWWRYVRFWGSNVRDDVNDELRFHVDMRVAEYVARGMSENEARRRAADRFGNVDRARDSCVDIQEKHARAEGRAELGSVLQRDVAFGRECCAGSRSPRWSRPCASRSASARLRRCSASATRSCCGHCLPERRPARAIGSGRDATCAAPASR